MSRTRWTDATLFLFLILGCVSHAAFVDFYIDCPEPNCNNTTQGKLVEDPENCHQFYMCVNNGTDMVPVGPADCPDGQHFNKSEGKCVAGDKCTPSCDSGGAGNCIFACVDDDTLVANRLDCSLYYTCTGTDIEASKRCPEDAPYFDGDACQTDEAKCCHCKPYCDENSGLGDHVSDPLDCTRYFICTGQNEVPILSSSCSSGTYFDETTGTCSSFVSCDTQCTNVVGSDGCIRVYTCEAAGYFAKCPQRCSAQYYHCKQEDVGSIIAAESCDKLFFNPDSAQCVPSDECPYPEP